MQLIDLFRVTVSDAAKLASSPQKADKSQHIFRSMCPGAEGRDGVCVVWLLTLTLTLPFTDASFEGLLRAWRVQSQRVVALMCAGGALRCCCFFALGPFPPSSKSRGVFSLSVAARSFAQLG